jgi:hypothetical protein
MALPAHVCMCSLACGRPGDSALLLACMFGVLLLFHMYASDAVALTIRSQTSALTTFKSDGTQPRPKSRNTLKTLHKERNPRMLDSLDLYTLGEVRPLRSLLVVCCTYAALNLPPPPHVVQRQRTIGVAWNA